ncbi:MAG: LLM class flavin-dependent oxidoreductase [Geodermatophilaceae bacterium]|nr:LLM class flavin-dependent oxidoreductase [Geodermatophilaceae bacterium]
MTVIPTPALIVLVGASGSGKTTWAQGRFAASEIVSSDALRVIVGTGEGDLDASSDAFALLDAVVAARARRRLTTVIDTLGLDTERRLAAISLGHSAGLPVVAIRFDADPEVCRQRNRLRDRPVPANALASQLLRVAALDLTADGFDVVVVIGPQAPPVVEPTHLPGSAAARAAQEEAPTGLRFALQISAFPWGRDPRAWLAGVARSAENSGFSALAVMDHLLQIPQVGRAWEPMPEAYVTLGYLAGVTDRMELGTLVSPVTFRSVPLLAKMIATLDAVSGGRAFLGLGAGWYAREHAAYDLEFPSAAGRLDALEAGIGVLRAFWGAGTKPYGALPETTSYPRPTRLRVPIIVGGGGEQRTLDIAARLADGCNLPAALAGLEHKLAIFRAHLDRAGRDPAEVQITVLDLPLVGRDPDDVERLVEKLRGRQPASTYRKLHQAGTVADHIGRYRQLAEAGVGTVFVAMPDLSGPAQIEKFASIVASFSG